MISVVSTFRNYLNYTVSSSSPLISSRETSICSLLEKCCNFQNKLELRLLGFDCLIILLTRQPTLSSANYLFSSLLDYEALGESVRGATASPLPPSIPTNPPSEAIRDSVEVFSRLLELIKPGDKLSFWFDLVSREYLSVFYPEAGVWKEKSPFASKITFVFCPPEIQKAIIEKISSWTESPILSAMLWDPATTPLTLEICKQSCKLPISYGQTIRTSMETFRTWLFSDEASKNLVGEASLQVYWRHFLQHISRILLLKSAGNDQLRLHTLLCNDVLDVFGYLSFLVEQPLETETWRVLQETLLNSICEMLQLSAPTAINSITHSITDELFHSLFLFWLQSPITTPEMWAFLREKLTALTDWKQLVAQWKEKVMSLTFLLGSWLYQDHTTRKKARDSIFGIQELEQEAATGLPPDHPIATINWNLERLNSVWYILLHVLGPLARMPNATNYTIAVSGIAEVVEFLLHCEERLSPQEPPPIPLFEIFLPEIFEMLRVDDRERNRGHLIAYSTLCRLFCRPHIRNMPIQFLAHFYQHLKTGLAPSSHISVVWVILRYASDLFTFALPGSNILILDFLNAISRIFDADNPTKPPKDVQFKALTVLASLLCFPSKFQGTSLPSFSSATGVSAVKFEDIRDLLSNTLLKVARHPELHSARCVPLALWSLADLVWIEVHAEHPRNHVLRDSFQVLLEFSKNKNEAVVESALEALSFLAPIQDLINVQDGSLRKLFAATLSNSIVTLIERGKASGELAESSIIAHYYAILEWMVANRTVLIDSRSLLEKVFRAVEYGLLGQVVEDPDATVTTTSESSSSTDKNKKKTRKKAPRPQVIGEQLASKALLFDHLLKSPTHGSIKVREAAEVFLLTVITHYSNFPSIAGTEQICSWTSPKDIDESGEDLLYFIWNGSTILSFQEIEAHGDIPIVRVTSRNYTGKYVWDLTLDYNGPAKNRPRSRMTCLISSGAAKSELPAAVPSSSTTLHSSSGDGLPVFQAGVDYQESDLLLDALSWLEKTHPETQPGDTIFFTRPFLPNPSSSKDIDVARDRLEHQEDIENRYLSSLDLRERPSFPLKPVSPTPLSAIHHCRLFLSHLGFLTPESRQTLHFLDNNARFKRSLKELDKLTGREVMKIGLIFVKPGQEDQHSILANDTRSPKYARFVAGLGWEVNLATHSGFMGGLDRKSTTGFSAPYYCDSLVEVIFHDITRMPTHADDLQQIHKKRHVGNDIVHIVWSEHSRLYKPSTITSQFNDVHIIIYPLPNELYKISIQQKENIGPFGPLQDGMIVSESLLSPLVRMTAINANRVVRKLQEVYKKPFPIRAYHIREINQRYKVEKTFDSFLGALFPPLIEDVPKRKSVDDIPESTRRALRLSQQASLAASSST